jgi:hypothetical protein
MTASLLESADPAAELPSAPSSLEQGVIQEARRRRQLRRRRVAVVLAVAIAGSVAGANLGGGPPRNAPSPNPHSGRAATGARTTASKDGAVRLVPGLEGGSYGWEVVIDRGSTCCTTPVSADPLNGGVAVEPTRSHERLTFLAGPDLAAVVVDGRRRPVVALPGHLSFHLRLVQVDVPRARVGVGASQATPGSPGAPPAPVTPATLMALDRHGYAIPSVLNASPQVAIRWWEHPSAAPPGPCRLRTRGLGELTPEWGHVASAIVPYRVQIVGRAFFSCMDTEYYLHGWPLKAAILLDAAHPGSEPAAIPGLRPIRGAQRLLDGPGPVGQGGLTATRLGNAWLVVAGGSGRAQRVLVLRHLFARIDL